MDFFIQEQRPTTRSASVHPAHSQNHTHHHHHHHHQSAFSLDGPGYGLSSFSLDAEDSLSQMFSPPPLSLSALEPPQHYQHQHQHHLHHAHHHAQQPQQPRARSPCPHLQCPPTPIQRALAPPVVTFPPLQLEGGTEESFRLFQQQQQQILQQRELRRQQLLQLWDGLWDGTSVHLFQPCAERAELHSFILECGGLGVDALARVERFIFPEADSQCDCSVCLDTFEAGDDCAALPCSHVFHTNCLKNWFKCSRQCPNCRRDVTL